MSPRFLILTFAVAFLSAPALAAKDAQEAAGKVAPKSAEAKAESAERKAQAEWIKRCDKLAVGQRMACLDEVRAEIAKKVAEPQSQ